MSIDIDVAALHRLLGAGGPDLVDRMVLLFLRNTPDRLSLLRTGAQADDWASAERAAHSLKSTAAHLGLVELRGRAGEAEVLAREGRGQELCALLNGLDRAFSSVRADLPGILQQISAL